MKIHTYSHNQGAKCVHQHILSPLCDDLRNFDCSNITIGAKQIRKAILKILASHGWPGEVKLIQDMGITITSIYDQVGLCLQFGNMARFYADLLKLQLMFNNHRIESAIYILPTKKFSTILNPPSGGNQVNYERFTRELQLFNRIINIPILVLGIESI